MSMNKSQHKEIYQEMADTNKSVVDMLVETRAKLKKYETESMITEVIDHEDGSATIMMDLDEETQGMLIKQGLQYIIDEMRNTDKVKVLDANEFSDTNKTYELTDEDANALFHFGFLYAIKAGMEEMDNE